MSASTIRGACEANFESAMRGGKATELDQLRAELAALRDRVAALEKNQRTGTVYGPITPPPEYSAKGFP